jgi:hypothetical protein
VFFKVYCDNLFTTLDLLDHMGDRQLGVTGTLRQNRVIGIPLPTKKEVVKNFKRGEVQATYTQDATVVVWRDNQPVYMASNHERVEPMGSCQRYSQKEKCYIAVPQPKLNQEYNKNMGGVDLVDNSEKNYSITTRIKKWYWCLYTWFLNISMVQAWRLYRAHMKERHRLLGEVQTDDNEGKKKKQLEAERKRRRTGEKRIEDISLLEFTRQVVETLFIKHKEPSVFPQRENLLARPATVADVRFDSGRHLVKLSTIKGHCKQCPGRTTYRCIRCNVALHPELCFYKFHTPEEEWEDV